MSKERIKHIFKFMEYDYLTDRQMSFVVSLEKYFKRNGYLKPAQLEALEDIFEKTAEKVEWSRPDKGYTGFFGE